MQTRAVDQYLKDTSISAKRGTIYDCNMKVLAKSADVWKVVLEPNYITDDNRELICNGLSQILGLDKADLIERSKKKTYYDVVQNKVETDVKDQIVAFKEENEITNEMCIRDSPGTAKKGHALAIAPRCVYHARQDREDHLYWKGQGAEKPRQPVFWQ